MYHNHDFIITIPWGNGLEDTGIEGMFANKLELRIHNKISCENAQMQHYHPNVDVACLLFKPRFILACFETKCVLKKTAMHKWVYLAFRKSVLRDILYF